MDSNLVLQDLIRLLSRFDTAASLRDVVMLVTWTITALVDNKPGKTDHSKSGRLAQSKLTVCIDCVHVTGMYF